MSQAEFITANLAEHRAELVELNIEYISWVMEHVEEWFGVTPGEALGMGVPEYVQGTIDKVCAEPGSGGVFYLVRAGGRLAGMGGLRSLGPGVAEVKRIYFRPACRGLGLGGQMLDRLLADAAAHGHHRVCLDSAPFMQDAHRLYEARGFTDCPPYEGVEAPPQYHSRWRFMRRALAPAGA